MAEAKLDTIINAASKSPRLALSLVAGQGLRRLSVAAVAPTRRLGSPRASIGISKARTKSSPPSWTASSSGCWPTSRRARRPNSPIPGLPQRRPDAAYPLLREGKVISVPRA